MKLSRKQSIFGKWRTDFQSGDTIVEVLIAMAIISIVLGGAYVTARASTTGTRDSQERSEALKIAETQLEELRARSPDGAIPAAINTTPNLAFCFDTSTGNASTTFNLPANFSTDDFSTYPTNPPNPVSCVMNSDSLPYASFGVPYHVGITFNNTVNVYTVHVRWDRLGGSKDETILSYRYGTDGLFGFAQIGNCGSVGITCTPDPGSIPFSPLAYFYGTTLWNLTDTHGKTVVSCDWNWTDASPDDHNYCNYDAISGIQHCFPIPPNPDVTIKNYNVVLTMHYSDGSTGTSTYPVSVPWSSTDYPPSYLSCGKLAP